MTLPAEILRMLETPSRFHQKLEVENSIYDFSPDCEEAEELLDTLIASLERKYRELDTSELGHYAKYLRKALERLQDQIPEEPDEIGAYKEAQARRG